MRARRCRPAGRPTPLAAIGGAHHFQGDATPEPGRRNQGLSHMDQNALVQFLPLVLIFIVFYFLLIRPQQQKQKQHRTMLDALRRGDRVVTGGGLLGTVSRVVNDQEVEVDLAPNVRVKALRSTISQVLSKPDPAAAREAAKDRDAAKEKEPAP